jgi:tryptophanyl-tRNA synthetase
MSKSENQNATLYLADSDETIRKKIKKAKTESGWVRPGRQCRNRLPISFCLLRLVAGIPM